MATKNTTKRTPRNSRTASEKTISAGKAGQNLLTTNGWQDIVLERPEAQFSDAEIDSFATYIALQVERDSEPIAVLMVTLRRLANIARFSDSIAEVQDAVTRINDQLFANSEAADEASGSFEAKARECYEALLKGGN